MNRLTIGQMAEMNHVSEQTLRYYDKINILKPLYVDKETGYRYYSIKQNARLDLIQYMKSLGMSLKEIESQLKTCDINLIKNVLEKKTVQIDDELEKLKLQKAALLRAINNYERYQSSPPDGTIVLEFMNKRFIYSYKTNINFYDYDIEVYEELLGRLKEDMEQRKLKNYYFCNAGSTVSFENILKRKYISDTLFVFVDYEYVTKEIITTIPSSTYLCIYCNKFENEISYANKLLDEVFKRNYTITGDYICEVITELPDYLENERGMFFKLQIPVKI